jgi:hypothetical protein
MKYQTPQLQPAGVASVLIQTKISPKVDSSDNLHTQALNTLLEID